MFKRLQDFFAFTKNEQKVFLFLAVIFLAGASIKIYKVYIAPQQIEIKQFDYSKSDSIFYERSKNLSAEQTDTSIAQVTERPKKNKLVEKIHLNGASKQQLTLLPGIGNAVAEKIIEYRKEHGAFKELDELKNVKGIGEKKFEKLKELVEIN